MSAASRPGRRWHVQPAPAELRLAEPPARSTFTTSWSTALLPVIGMLPVALFTVRGTGGIGLLAVLVVPTLGASALLAVGARRRQRRERAGSRERWWIHRSDLVEQAARAAAIQRSARDRVHPAPGTLLALVAEGAAFERRIDDADALHVVVGTGPIPALVRVTRTAAPLADCEPDLAAAAAAAVADTAVLHAAAVDVSIRTARVLAIRSAVRAEAQGVARALIAQLAALHAPTELALAGAVADTAEWEWATALPHTDGGPGFTDDPDALALWFQRGAHDRARSGSASSRATSQDAAPTSTMRSRRTAS